MVNRIIKKKEWSLIKILAMAGIVSLVAMASASYYFTYGKTRLHVESDRISSMGSHYQTDSDSLALVQKRDLIKKQPEVNHRTDNRSSMSYVPTLQMLVSLIKFVRS